MRLALYYPWVHLTGGPERILVELTSRSRHQWEILTNHYDAAHSFPELRGRTIVELPRVPVERSLAKVASAGLRIVLQRLPTRGFDALVVMCEGLGDLVVFRNHDLPTLCLCLTPLRPAYDDNYRERALRSRGFFARTVLKAGLAVFRAADRLAWRRFDHVLCISQEARRRAVLGGLPRAAAADVAYPGPGLPGAADVSFEPFFLLPGRVMWTKNLELGIAAFQRLRQAHPELAGYRLVVAGIVDRKSEPYFARLRALAGGDPSIEFRVLPTDAELAELYRTCRAVLFTAFNEDWGIVPLEAMAFGKPVIATNRGGPRESIVHGEQGFLEEPEPEAFAARMAELALDPGLAASMGRAGRERSQAFSWEAFTAGLDRAVERAVAERRLQVSRTAGRARAAAESAGEAGR